jgi:hypothetical protein
MFTIAPNSAVIRDWYNPVKLPTSVRLEASHAPLFPDRCVVCNRPVETRSKISGRPYGWNGMIAWLLRQTPKVLVPMHPNCATALKWRLSGMRTATFLIATAAGLGAAAIGISKLMAVVIFVAILTPLIFIDLFWPPALDITGGPTFTEFEFKDSKYAEEFARLNGVDVD